MPPRWSPFAADFAGEPTERPTAAVSAGSATSAVARRVSAPLVIPGELAQVQLSRWERWLAAAAAAVLLLAGIIMTRISQHPWPPLHGFIGCYATGSIILDLMVTILLIAKNKIVYSPARVYFAAAYFYAALIIMPQAASFPDSLRPGIFIGQPGSAVWLWVFWRTGFAWLLLRYGCATSVKTGPRIYVALLLVIAVVALAAFAGLRRADAMPSLINAGHYFSTPFGRLVALTVLISNVGALAAVATRLRYRAPEDMWLAVGLVGVCVDIWLTLSGGARFSLGWYCGRLAGLSASFMVFISLMNDVLQNFKRVAAANDILDRLTVTDPLTKLGNRRIFDTTLQNEWRRCRRDLLPLSVVLFDVDYFKKFNDTYGHLAGDACLETIAKCLRDAASRAGDLAARYGGEEFALILPGTDSGGAAYVANMVRLSVRDAAIPHGGGEKELAAPRTVTISAGVATLVPSESFDASELVKLADQALYRAKANGRNNVAIAG